MRPNYEPELDSHVSRAARVQLAMGGSGAAAARALRAVTDAASAGTSRDKDSQDIAAWYASMKSAAAVVKSVAPPPPAAGAVGLLDLPEDVWLALLGHVASPLLPAVGVGLASCCKAVRQMTALRKASMAFKAQHAAASALSAKCGMTAARMGTPRLARLAWTAKGLRCADMRVLAQLVRFMPQLSELGAQKLGLDQTTSAPRCAHLPPLRPHPAAMPTLCRCAHLQPLCPPPPARPEVA